LRDEKSILLNCQPQKSTGLEAKFIQDLILGAPGGFLAD
jgi:hypothetical protein